MGSIKVVRSPTTSLKPSSGCVGAGARPLAHTSGTCRRVNRALFEHYRETIQRRPQKSPRFALTNAHFKNSIYFIVNRQPTSQAGRLGFSSLLPLQDISNLGIPTKPVCSK